MRKQILVALLLAAISAPAFSQNATIAGGSSTPSGAAGGGLTGTYPNPTVATNANLTGAITSVGNAASLGSFSSANLATALTNETGTGVAVFDTSPTFTTGITVNGTIGSTGTTNVQSAVNVDSISNVTASGTGTANFQLISAGAGNNIQTDATGDLNFTANGVVASVIKMVHAGASASSLVVTGGGISVGTTTSAGGLGNALINGQGFLPNATSDSGLADATACLRVSNGQFLKGSGTLGICLGTSGAQFKTAFAPMVAGIDEIAKIQLYNYRYREGFGDSGERVQYGATAQDVEKVLPDLVRYDSSGEVINYDIGAFVPIALHALQQLKTENDDLRTCNKNWKCRLFGVGAN